MIGLIGESGWIRTFALLCGSGQFKCFLRANTDGNYSASTCAPFVRHLTFADGAFLHRRSAPEDFARFYAFRTTYRLPMHPVTLVSSWERSFLEVLRIGSRLHHYLGTQLLHFGSDDRGFRTRAYCPRNTESLGVLSLEQPTSSKFRGGSQYLNIEFTDD